MAKKYGVVIDIGSCIGCDVCTVSCKLANNVAPMKDDVPGSREWPKWIQVHRIFKGIYPDVSMHYLPVMCMNCQNAPCIPSCPWEAIYQREDGVVVVNESGCDACRDFVGGPKCIPACPYEVIHFYPEGGIVGFCTLCADRLDLGLTPACMQACEGQVFTIGDLNDPNGEISKVIRAAGERAFVLMPDKGARPAIWYIRPSELNLDEVTSVLEKIGD